MRGHHSSADSSARTMLWSWVRNPSIPTRPLPFIFKLCTILCCHGVEKRTKINKKSAEFGPIWKNLHLPISLFPTTTTREAGCRIQKHLLVIFQVKMSTAATKPKLMNDIFGSVRLSKRNICFAFVSPISFVKPPESLPAFCRHTKVNNQHFQMYGPDFTEWHATSVTRLDDFWKFLATKYLTKVAQILGNFLGCCEKHYFSSKNFLFLLFGHS